MIVVITALCLGFFAIVSCVDNYKDLDKYTEYSSDIVTCYLPLWVVYRKGNGEFKLNNIKPELCDHLILGYASLDAENCTISMFGSWDDMVGDKNESRILKLKEINPSLKVSISLGGWVDGSIKYSQFVAKPEKRRKFVENIVVVLREYELDGLDIVWEYPAKRGGVPLDKVNYVEFLKELRTTFDQYNYILTAAVGCSKDTIDYGYDVPKMSKYLHRMHVNSYDFYGHWSRVTGPHSGLRGSSYLNVEFSINYLLKLGADPKKMILGVPFYGRSFVFAEDRPFDKNQPILGQAFDQNVKIQGPLTEEEGYLGYNEICLELKTSPQKWEKYWDNTSSTPYMVSGNKLVVYEDMQSIKEKVKFAMEKKLGGCFAYSIDTDDFRGDCAHETEINVTFPLLTTLRSELDDYFNGIFIGNWGKFRPIKARNGSAGVKVNVFYIYATVVLVTFSILEHVKA